MAETTAQLFGVYFFLFHVSIPRKHFVSTMFDLGQPCTDVRESAGDTQRSPSPILTHSSRIHSRCGAARCISGMRMGSGSEQKFL